MRKALRKAWFNFRFPKEDFTVSLLPLCCWHTTHCFCCMLADVISYHIYCRAIFGGFYPRQEKNMTLSDDDSARHIHQLGNPVLCLDDNFNTDRESTSRHCLRICCECVTLSPHHVPLTVLTFGLNGLCGLLLYMVCHFYCSREEENTAALTDNTSKHRFSARAHQTGFLKCIWHMYEHCHLVEREVDGTWGVDVD